MLNLFNKACRLSASLLGVASLGMPMQAVAADCCVAQPTYCYSEDSGCNPCETSCCGIGTNAAVLGGAIILGGVAGAIAGNSSKGHRGHSGSSGSFDFTRDIGQTIDGTVSFAANIIAGSATYTVAITGPDQVTYVGLTTPLLTGGNVSALPTIVDPAFGSYTLTLQINLSSPADVIVIDNPVVGTLVLSRSPVPVVVPIAGGPITGLLEIQLSSPFTYAPSATTVP